MAEMQKKDEVAAKLNRFLWETQAPNLSWWRVALVQPSRIIYVMFEEIMSGQLTLRAMSLVFTTLLALVPLLAVSFSVLKALGVHNQMEPLLLQFLAPLGDKGVEINNKIIDFVENVKAGVLGSLGLLFLFYTVYSLINKVETAFNYIWQLNRKRTLLRRFSDYLSVLFVGPVLVFSALGISAAIAGTSIMQQLIMIEPFGILFNILTRLTPYLLIIAAFTFLYMFIPNTRVKFRAALIGGMVSGIIWQTCSWFFAGFIMSSSNYTAIYSGFAILIFFMLWIYLNWLILLLGASLTYYIQHPENRVPARYQLSLSIAEKEKLSLSLLFLIGKRLYGRQPPASIYDFSRYLQIPLRVAEVLLESLVKSGLLTETAADPPAYVAAVALDQLTAKQALDLIRDAHMRGDRLRGFEIDLPAVKNVMQLLDESMTHSLSKLTIRQILDESESLNK